MNRLDRGPGHDPDDGQGPVRGKDAPSIGAELRDARLKLGQELADVAAVLRIRRVFLEAIEEDHFDQLPGAPYVIGFIRAYAGHLGLDPDEVVRCFREEASGLERQTDLAFPEVITESRIPRGAILLISMVLVVAAYGGWYYLSANDIAISEIIPAVPEKLANLVSGEGPGAPAPDGAPTVEAEAPEPAKAPAAPEAGAGEQEAASAPVKEEKPKATAKPPAPADAGGAEAPALPAPEPFASSPEALAIEPVSRTRPVAVAAAPAAPPAAVKLPDTGVPEVPGVPRQSAALAERQPRVYGEGNSDSRVILRATRDSWIQVHGADNVLLLTRVLRAGDSYRVPNRDGLTLVTGNAGALEILVDGEPVPAIGPFGTVRRNVSLDPSRLKTGSAVAN